MHWYTCISPLNTLGRAVEQLAACLAKQQKSAVEVKVQQSCKSQREMSYELHLISPLNTLERAVEQLTACLAKQQKSAVEVKTVQQSCKSQREMSYEYLIR